MCWILGKIQKKKNSSKKIGGAAVDVTFWETECKM